MNRHGQTWSDMVRPMLAISHPLSLPPHPPLCSHFFFHPGPDLENQISNKKKSQSSLKTRFSDTESGHGVRTTESGHGVTDEEERGCHGGEVESSRDDEKTRMTLIHLCFYEHTPTGS